MLLFPSLSILIWYSEQIIIRYTAIQSIKIPASETFVPLQVFSTIANTPVSGEINVGLVLSVANQAAIRIPVGTVEPVAVSVATQAAIRIPASPGS